MFELLSINLYELLKQNQFRGLPLPLIRHFIKQIIEVRSAVRSCRARDRVALDVGVVAGARFAVLACMVAVLILSRQKDLGIGNGCFTTAALSTRFVDDLHGAFTHTALMLCKNDGGVFSPHEHFHNNIDETAHILEPSRFAVLKNACRHASMFLREPGRWLHILTPPAASRSNCLPHDRLCKPWSRQALFTAILSRRTCCS